MTVGTVRARGLHATGPSGGMYASELFRRDRGRDTPDEAGWRTEIGWPIFRADAAGA